MEKEVIILGVRGVPASHGGFETFAEYLCKYLIGKNWRVIVYCQEEGAGRLYESSWQGIRRIHIPVNNAGPLGTIIFDSKSVVHSLLHHQGVFLTLGYNTAIFNVLHRLAGKKNIINMDGIEWRRQKWGTVAKVWFWLNERLGCWFGNHLVADHPRIESHLATRVSREKITMIPYGAPLVSDASIQVLDELGLTADNYGIVVARAEPENSIVEVVKAFSSKKRGAKLVVLGSYEPSNAYHQQVLAAASDEVIFPGAIYEADKVGALRFYARFYVHGHQVGGTNPSLVEALGAGCAVLAHDNPFNRWVAEGAAVYFANVETASNLIEKLFNDGGLQQGLKSNAITLHLERFQWDDILVQYEQLLAEWHG